MTKKILALILAAVMVFSLAACGKSGKTPEVEQITVGTTAAIEKAVMGEYNYEMLASAVTHLPLVWQDTKGAFHPLLAEYSTSDSKTWTYTIVDGMKWSDGKDVTAEDILFTLQYEDEAGSANLIPQSDKDGKTVDPKYTSYKLSDDKKSIELTLATPNVRELGNMTSFRVLPKHIYEGKSEVSDDEARIGNGPYVFENFSKDSGTISFVVNKNFKETPNVERIVYQLFGNEDTMYMALEKGDIDMVWNYSSGVGASYQDSLRTSENVKLTSVAATNAPAVLAVNNAKGPFANEDLRKAVAFALDYEQLRSKVGSVDAQTPNRGFVPTSTIGYKDTEALKTDLVEAEKYMNAAGYTKNADGKFVDAGGKAFGFTLTFRSDRNNHVSCADIIKNCLESFGIEVKLEPLDSASYNAKTSNKFSENNITMEAALFGYTSAGMSMGAGLGTIYVDGTHAVQGGCQVFDETFKAAVNELGSAATLEEYGKAAAKVQDYYAEHMPLVGLYWDSLTYGSSAKIDNMTIDNVFGLNNANNWLSITVK